MAPYYEDKHVLEPGTKTGIGPGPRKSTVEILDDGHALITPYDPERCFFVGKVKLEDRGRFSQGWVWKGSTREVQGCVVLCRESVSTNPRRPQVAWSKERL